LSDEADLKQLLAASTVEDIPLLVALKSRLYHRLSDECLYEVQKIDHVILRLGRSRYRKQVGTCLQVEPVNSTLPSSKPEGQ